MSTKRVCDRCGTTIPYEATKHYAGMSMFRYEGKMSHELCNSCAYLLDRWLAGKEKMTGEVKNDV